MSARFAWLVVAALGAAGCIEGQRPLATAADGAGPVGQGDAPEGPVDTGGAVEGDAAAGGSEVDTGGAVADAEGLDADAAPDGLGPGPDAVADDTRAPADAAACEEVEDCPGAATLGACWEVRCEGGGCVMEASVEGTPCDNGSGPVVGSCAAAGDGGRDRCDGLGACVDGAAAGEVGVQLAGAWHIVASSMSAGVPAGQTVRGTLTLGPTGAAQIESLSQSGTIATPFLPTGPLSFCASADLDVRLALSDGRTVSGVATPSLGVIALPMPDQRVVAVAVRAEGAPQQIDGTYHVVSTSRDPAGGLRTWYGMIPFSEGCQSGEGALFTAEGGPYAPQWTFDPPAAGTTRCWAPGPDGVAPLEISLALRPFGATTGQTAVTWRGAASPDGAVLVLTRDDGAAAPTYGTILLVRGGASAPAVAGTVWAYAFQGSRVVPAGYPVAEMGRIELADLGGALGGAVQVGGQPTAETILGDGFMSLADRRLDLTMRTASSTRRLSGRVAAGDEFAVLYTSVAVGDGPLALNLVHQAPSLGVLVRRLPEP